MTSTFTAHGGLTLPAVGFGTYQLKGSGGVDAIARAIGNGYTLIDSAFNYENEGTVGKAIAVSGANRRDLTITSKLPGRHHDDHQALATVEESVYRLGLDSVDLYLIHWPNPLTNKYVEAWRALIEARERGLVSAIGVCNFLPKQLERLEAETGVLPEVNQIELHPYFPQEDMLAYNAAHGILTEAWSPIGRGNDVLGNPVVTAVAQAHSVSPAEIVLAWEVARGAIPLPKATSDQHQLSNLAAADVSLSAEEIAAITALGRPDGRLAAQDPATYEEF